MEEMFFGKPSIMKKEITNGNIGFNADAKAGSLILS